VLAGGRLRTAAPARQGLLRQTPRAIPMASSASMPDRALASLQRAPRGCGSSRQRPRTRATSVPSRHRIRTLAVRHHRCRRTHRWSAFTTAAIGYARAPAALPAAPHSRPARKTRPVNGIGSIRTRAPSVRRHDATAAPALPGGVPRILARHVKVPRTVSSVPIRSTVVARFDTCRTVLRSARVSTPTKPCAVLALHALALRPGRSKMGRHSPKVRPRLRASMASAKLSAPRRVANSPQIAAHRTNAVKPAPAPGSIHCRDPIFVERLTVPVADAKGREIRQLS
jgi:hypothetical protein